MAESVMARQAIVKPEWHYEIGTLLKPFLDLYDRTRDQRYLDYVRANVEAYVQPDGSIRTYRKTEYNIDQVNSGKLVVALFERTREPRYRIAAETLRAQMRTHPRTAEGGFWHKQIYPEQMWLDGLYMGAAFLAQYARAFDEPALFDDVARQSLLMAARTRDPKTGLHYHAYDATRRMYWADSLTGHSPHFWGRAMGWYLMALVDQLDYLPRNHPDRAAVVRVFRRAAEAVAKVQDPPSGLWYQVLDQGNRARNYLEASASSMFVYALMKGARMGYLDASYRDVARRGYRGLLDRLVTVDENGLVNLNQICLVAGLGGAQRRDGSYRYYVSEPAGANDPKGVGPFIMASLEIERAAAPLRPRARR